MHQDQRESQVRFRCGYIEKGHDGHDATIQLHAGCAVSTRGRARRKGLGAPGYRGAKHQKACRAKGVPPCPEYSRADLMVI